MPLDKFFAEVQPQASAKFTLGTLVADVFTQPEKLAQ
jgi:hypothetical protein